MIKTTIENYQEQAGRTMATLGSKVLDGVHMALGFTTETLEMEEGILNEDKINIQVFGKRVYYIWIEFRRYSIGS